MEIAEYNIEHICVIQEERRPLDEQQVKALAQSIQEVGLLHPITIKPSNVLSAGWHRLAACKSLGWTMIPAMVIDLDELRNELLQIDENLARNVGTALERIEALARRKVIYEELHPEAKAGTRRATGMNKSLGYDVAEINAATFAQDTAAKTGKTDRSIRQDVQIAKLLTGETKETIRDTEVADKKTELLELAKIEPEQQQEVAAKLKTGKAKTVRDAKRQIIQEQAKEAPLLPSDKYRIIYADPPWKYSNTMPDNFKEQADHYPLMTVTELCEFPVKNITADNAVLFIWVTSPILEDAFKVIIAWGFKYKASFLWDKIKHNMGHYNSVRHEFLLICVKGSAQPDVKKLFDSVVSIERGQHSEKPERFREIIDTLYTHGKRIELFARRKVDGWDCHGNEVPRFEK